MGVVRMRRSNFSHSSKDPVCGAVIGKNAGADQRMAKATWPALFGLDESVVRCDELVQSAMLNLSVFAGDANSLKSLANYIVERIH